MPDDELSPAVRIQVRLDSARTALWSALNACPKDDLEFNEERILLGLTVELAERAHAAVRRKTGV